MKSRHFLASLVALLAIAAPSSRLRSQEIVWSPVEGLTNLHDVHHIVVDNRDGIFALTKIQVFRTNDRCGSWTLQRSSPDGLYRRMLCAPNDHLYILGDTLLHSLDNGETWRDVLIDEWITALAAAPGGMLYAGAPGAFYRTDDDGASWTNMQYGSPCATIPLVSMIASDGGVLLGTGIGTGIYRSLDHGQCWQRLTASVAVLDMTRDDDGRIYGFAPGGAPLRSDDSGRTWLTVGRGLNGGTLKCLRLDRHGVLWAGCWRGLYRSTDRGENWTRVQGGPTVHTVTAIAFDSRDEIYVATEGQGLFHGVPTTSVVFDQRGATDFRLEQNVPNPCNAQTTISFSLPIRARVRLDLFDARGRLVSTLVDDERSAGEHRLSVETGRLAAGVYTCRMQVAGSTATRSMVVIR